MGALVLIFITLKLIGIINWSWFWVLFPFTLPISIGFVIVMIYGFLALKSQLALKFRKK